METYLDKIINRIKDLEKFMSNLNTKITQLQSDVDKIKETLNIETTSTTTDSE